jgi:hypothetical protein
MWWNIYQGCLQVGFNETQAFALLQTFLLAQNPQGIQPPSQSGPSTDKPDSG